MKNLSLKLYLVPYEYEEVVVTSMSTYAMTVATNSTTIKTKSHTYLVHNGHEIRKLMWTVSYQNSSWLPTFIWYWGEAEPNEAVKLMAHGYTRKFENLTAAVTELLGMALYADNPMGRKVTYYARKDTKKTIDFGDPMCFPEGDAKPSKVA